MSAPLFIVTALHLLLAVYAHASGAATSMQVIGDAVVVVVVFVVVVVEVVVVAVVVALHCVKEPVFVATAPATVGGFS
jgi:hypothetical protein